MSHDKEKETAEICAGSICIDENHLEDVRLWGKLGEKLTFAFDDFEYLARVDGRRVPLWMTEGSPLRIFSCNSATVRFLQTSLGGHAGLLFQLRGYDMQFMIYAADRCVYGICLRMLKGLAEQRATGNEDADAAPTFLSMPEDEASLEARQKQAATMERMLEKKRSQNSTFNISSFKRISSVGQLQWMRDTSVPLTTTPPSEAVKSATQATVDVAPLLTSHELAAKEALQRVVMSGLRLRGLTSTDDEYKTVYQHTARAALFALRKQMKDHVPDVSTMQETVEKLLSIFL